MQNDSIDDAGWDIREPQSCAMMVPYSTLGYYFNVEKAIYDEWIKERKLRWFRMDKGGVKCFLVEHIVEDVEKQYLTPLFLQNQIVRNRNILTQSEQIKNEEIINFLEPINKEDGQMVKLILDQSIRIKDQRISKPYTVLGVHNSVEWKVRQRLTRDEVKELVARKSVQQKELDVKIV